jgi:hypothetical protein
MGGMATPLMNLLNSQHHPDSPNFVNGASPNFPNENPGDLLVDINDIRNDCRSEGRSSVMSSLSEVSYGAMMEEKAKQDNKSKNRILEVGSCKDITIENVNPARPANMFNDLGSVNATASEHERPKVGEPEVAVEKERKVRSVLS